MTRIGAKPTAETCDKNQHTNCEYHGIVSNEQNQLFLEMTSKLAKTMTLKEEFKLANITFQRDAAI